eukprot:6396865-Pyramimonas_sp.AAC.1
MAVPALKQCKAALTRRGGLYRNKLAKHNTFWRRTLNGQARSTTRKVTTRKWPGSAAGSLRYIIQRTT